MDSSGQADRLGAWGGAPGEAGGGQCGSGGVGPAAPGGRAGSESPRAAVMPQAALLSLRLPSREEEEAYWVEAGTPALAWLDAWALLYTSFNVAIGHVVAAKSAHAASMPGLVQRCLDAASLVLFLAALLGRAWLSFDLESYCRHRTAFACANRVARSVFMLTVCTQMSIEGWRDFVLHAKPGRDPLELAPPAAATAVLKALSLSATYWAMHALLFPFRLSLAAPLHAAFCLAAWPCLRGFVCMVYADAPLTAGAQLLCVHLQRVTRAALWAMGVAAPVMDGACSARPLELLVPVFCALSCLGTLALLYERELAHKLAFLHASAARGGIAGPFQESGELVPVRRVAMAVVVLFAAFTCGEAAAAWAPPYQCTAVT